MIADKTPIYVDFEMYMDSKVSLSKLTMPMYMETAHRMGKTGVSIAVDDEEPIYFPDVEEPTTKKMMEYLNGLFLSGDYLFVGHNTAFDARVWVYVLGLNYPANQLCTLELAQAAFPNQPGGYSLKNLGAMLPNMPDKIDIDLHPGKHTPEELEEYCNQDVRVTRELYKRCIAVLCDDEIELAAITAHTRRINFYIDKNRAFKAIGEFAQQINTAAMDVVNEIGDPLAISSFGFNETPNNELDVRSVKPHVLKDYLLNYLGFDTTTISLKKMNPEKLRQNAAASKVIHSAAQANKALSHKRRISAVINEHKMPLNYMHAAAHTLRWSGKGSGKGVNPHNLPKRDPRVAKPIRSMLRLDPHHVWVRGDMANVEYRIEGWLAGCYHTSQLFSSDIRADPYISFGHAATGKMCGKKDPIRQVWKMCVLGLGFLMGLYTHSQNLAQMLAAYHIYGVDLDDFKQICRDNNWTLPADRYARFVKTKLSLPDEVVAVAYHTRELFHRVHPEFMWLAKWVDETIARALRSSDPAAAIDDQYKSRKAPDRKKIDLIYDDAVQGQSIGVRCGEWGRTLFWRDLAVRRDNYGKLSMSFIRAGNRGPRALTLNMIIENITQSCARNAMGLGMLCMKDLGWRDQFTVHDELMIYTPAEADRVIEARDDIVQVFGPGGVLSSQCYDWAAVVLPEDIMVTHSMYEDEDAWDKNYFDELRTGKRTVDIGELS